MVTIGENTYEWVRYAGLDWMTSNFKEGTPYYELTYINQYGYTDDLIKDCEDLTPEEWDRYGNLYSYEEAKANAPEGWRLPTDEDWKKLERAMGMSQGDADATGFRGTEEGDVYKRQVFTRPALRQLRFHLHTNRYASIREILDNLQSTNGIHFSYIGNKIYISQ